MSLDIKITITGGESLTAAFAACRQRAPAAMAKALNDTANSAQTQVRDGLASRFTLRRPDFMLRTIYRKPGQDFATNQKQQAAVGVNPERNYVAKFEDGGRKTARSGRDVAIPLPAVKRNKADVIGTANRPKGLMGKPGVRKVVTPHGTWIVQEKRKYKQMGARTEFLYKLQPDVPIRPMLGFVQTVNDAVTATFEGHAARAITVALLKLKAGA